MNKKVELPTVLIVDDDSLLREALKAILRSGDYKVVGEASNGEAALALCRKLRPGLVLLDINMPGMDGLEVLQGIKADSPKTKVIMISAEATHERVKDAILKGAVGFVVKPINAGRVLDDIEAVISGRTTGNG